MTLAASLAGGQPLQNDTKAGSTASHIGALDGLRAIAIGLVLIHHLMPERNASQGIRGALFKVAEIGWSGVDLFFVLSGFLITGILLRAKAGHQPMRHFMMRRLLRIVPAYALALLIVFVIVPLGFRAYAMPDIGFQAPFWLYVSNYFYASYLPLAGRVGMSHFWSLAVEMQFYLLWPFVIYRFGVRSIARIGVALLVLAWLGRAASVLLGAHWTVTFGWLPFRLDGLVIGSLIALALHEKVPFDRYKKLAYCVFACGLVFAASVAWFDRAGALFKGNDYASDMVLRTVLPGTLSLLCGAVLWISLQRNKLSGILSHAAFKPLARYSYGIYIVHYMLYPLFEHIFGPSILKQWTGGLDSAIYLYFLIASAISFVIAMASYHLFEVHFLRLKSRF